MDGIDVRDGLSIPAEEITFTTSRSGGPGGQHVNKVSTRVTLWFNVNGSSALSDSQKRRIRERLAGRIGRDGRLRVVCGRHRSQAANREEATARFVGLLREALERRRSRRKTSVSGAERRRRLQEKRRRGDVKRLRSRPDED